MQSTRPPDVILSPHYDDAAFSLGAWIAGHPGGTLVDIFTRSSFVVGAGRGVPDAETVERISAIRQAEDRAFSSAHGLEVIELGLEEPSLRGRHSRDRAGVDDDVAQLHERLWQVLDRLVTDSEQAIFCPAAIGGHVNHVATRTVAIDWARARGRLQNLRFYEDLPYARRAGVRRRGLADLRDAVGGASLERRAWRAGREKLAAVRLYPTQLRKLPASLWGFSPRTLWPLGPHEAIWRITES
jgi:LmbE family N-acetylglucosaminyl deacetylase